MRPFIVGTAGHIDHGKSALVRALSGIDPDRLPEERRRGITIELGFAHGELVPGVQAAYVDVPGHERFVKAMVAGAHGVDVLLLVVALDEGVMPQTREHADICRLLGVPRAVVALTKDDLAPGLDADWPALVIEDIQNLGEPFASAPVVRVSARTGTGLPELKERLARAAKDLPERPLKTAALLPVDRAFSLKGHGTVVTGTLVAGQLHAGDALELVLPAPRQVEVVESLRARTLHVHGRVEETATAGQRVAVNLPGIEVGQVARGAALVAAGSGRVRASALLDVEVECVPGAPPIRSRSRLAIHLGTGQALATVDLLGLAELGPGERAVAQLRLDKALPALRDQRFVLRGFRALSHGGHTVAGGRVLLAGGRRRRAADREKVERLRGTPVQAAEAVVAEARLQGIEPERLALLVGRELSESKLQAAQKVGTRLFERAQLHALVEELRQLVRGKPGVPREEARTLLGPAVGAEAFAHAVAHLGPEFVAGDTLALAAVKKDPLEEAIAAHLAKTGLCPPTANELAQLTKADPYKVGGALRALAKAGRAVRLTDELFVDAHAAADFRRRAVELLERQGAVTTLELKELSGASRKFAIPLCEWLDREHVTLRVGDKRTLRKGGRSA